MPTGSTYGLIGPNGSGTTTMLSILAAKRLPLVSFNPATDLESAFLELTS